jgi:hypothetical protein
MTEQLEALKFYRYIQEVLKTEGIDHLTVHIDDEELEVNAVFKESLHGKRRL